MLKKKILAVFTIMVMLVSMFPVNVINAAETLKTNISLYLYPLEENQLFVGLYMNTPSDFAAANFELEYNADAFTYVSGDALPEMQSGTNQIKNNSSEGKVKMAYMANPEDENHTKSGGLYGFYFDINDNYSGEVSFVVTNPVMKRRDGASFEKTKHMAKMTLSGNNPLESISLDNTSLSLTEGEKDTLSVIYNPENTTDDKTVSWSSSDETVATVDSNGVVTAVSQGQTVITATVGNMTATCTVTVNKQEIALTSISLNKTEETLVVGQTDTLNVTYNPENTTEDITLSWSSSNEEVATVVDGVVITHKSGTAIITANVNGKTASCTYEVKDIELESIALSDASAIMEKGTTKDLTVMYNPENTTVDKIVSWTTSDASVAAVDGNGTVTAVGNGTVTITATVNGKIATCDITVKTTLKEILLNKTNSSIIKGENDTLEVTLNPVDATVTQSVEWTSSNDEIAIVSNGVVTALKPGKATITATLEGKTTTCDVTVLAPITSISLDKTATTIIKGQTDTLNISVEPVDTTDNIVANWTSSNDDIATVENGVVTAKGAGTTTITVSIGSKTATCEVTVIDIELEDIKLDVENAEINKGYSRKLEVKYIPENTTIDKNVIWTSSDETVAIVNNEGIVTALKPGKAVITAKVGEKTKSAVITVPEVHLTDAYIIYELVEITVGDMLQLYISTEPEISAVTDEITSVWMSEDESVATVDEFGIVTAKGVGETRISLVVNGTFESYVTVVVDEAPVQEENTEASAIVTAEETAPATGDIAVIAIAIIAIISIAGIIFVVVKNKKRK